MSLFAGIGYCLGKINNVALFVGPVVLIIGFILIALGIADRYNIRKLKTAITAFLLTIGIVISSILIYSISHIGIKKSISYIDNKVNFAFDVLLIIMLLVLVFKKRINKK